MATYTVTTTADAVDPSDGQLSLREALALADATEIRDTIQFAEAVQGGTIVLAGSQLTVNSDVAIDGGSGVTIDADGKSRVLLVQGGTPSPNEVTLAHLTVTGGRTVADNESGGGIRADRYTALTLDHVTVSGNSTTGAYGGGIAGYSVTLTGSTVSGNGTAGDDVSGGGIYADNFVTLTSSTVSGNSTAGVGVDGGGIFGSDVTLANSIVAGNTTVGGGGPDVDGSVLSNGLNIFGSAVDGSRPSDREHVSTDLLFSALDPVTGGGLLADNGGPTQTIALRDAPDNPALGRADPEISPATDQRGEARPQPAGTAPDIGAFELNQSGGSPHEIVGTDGPDFLRGTLGPDVIRGLGGDDRLWGRAGDDQLFGDDGRDVLAGKAGLDEMTGGAGADRFLFRAVTQAPPGGPAYDTILDFSHAEHDRIDLRPIDADRSEPGNQAFELIGEQAFTGPGQLRYEATADGLLVTGDTDGNFAADFAVLVHADVTQLHAGDFLL